MSFLQLFLLNVFDRRGFYLKQQTSELMPKPDCRGDAERGGVSGSVTKRVWPYGNSLDYLWGLACFVFDASSFLRLFLKISLNV